MPLGHLAPCKHVTEVNQLAALDLVTRIIAAMGARDGVLYFQMIVTPDGPRLVEIAPRLDGCHMWHLIRASQGVNLIEMAMNCLTGAAPVKTLPNAGAGDRHATDMELMFHNSPQHPLRSRPFSGGGEHHPPRIPLHKKPTHPTRKRNTRSRRVLR